MKYLFFINHSFQTLGSSWKVLSLLVFAVTLCFLLKIRNKTIGQAVLISSACAYIFFFFSTTVLSRNIGINQGIELDLRRDIDAIISGDFSVRLEALTNLIMLFPLGMLVCFIEKETSKRSLLRCTLFGISISVTIELIQLLFSLGCFELLDVICNSSGMILGYLVGSILMNTYRKIRFLFDRYID